VPKRVLVITYYWPPAGGSGVQRWLKFTKYFREFGWEPVIFTSLNPEAPAYDYGLLNEVPDGIEVIRRPVWEPYNMFRSLTGQKGQSFGAGLASSNKSGRSWIGKLSIWVRGNFFIPDARMFWISPSVRYLIKYIKDHPVDAIVSTGPPHSTHLIAKRVSKKLRIPWLADFRDPWTNIDFFLDLKPTKVASAIHRRLESSVLSSSDTIVTVTQGWGNDLIALGAKNLVVVENGFDEADFLEQPIDLDKYFSLTHIGTLSPNRNCNALWRALGNLTKRNAHFADKLKIRFVGSVDASALEAIEQNGLSKHCEFLGYLSHAEAISIQRQSQVLLLLVNQSPNAMGIQTGKVFEYLAAKRPIFAVGPLGGDTHSLIRQTNSGIFVDYKSETEMENGILKLWDWYNNSWEGFSPKEIDVYSRRGLAQKICTLLDDITDVK
jgi:hypothetical protein